MYELIGVLAVEVTLIVGVATLLARLARTASWRRTAWQVCFAGLCVLLVFEYTGLARAVASIA